MNPADLFSHTTDAVDYPAGSTVFSEGEKADCMYVVLEGSVDILVGQQIVETAGRGALLGEMALIDPSPRSAAVVARTACRLVSIDQRRFQFLLQQTPNFAVHVMRVLVERLRRMDYRMLQASQAPAAQ
jgi:CRP/FNR family cyclic AMP-dependent transcriptional regulator